jgi:hypothetical protein
MAYVAAADFRERTIKPWTANLTLDENEGTDAYIDLLITQMTTQVELDLADDFEPPTPDNDEIITVYGYGTTRLYTPRRVRSLTTVETRWPWTTTYTTQATTAYILRQSLNAAGTAMVDGRTADWLDALTGLSTGVWPYGADAVRLTGKFGWAAVPTDIKRLVALKVYDQVKAKSDPLSRIIERATGDGVVTYGPSTEMVDIVNRYRRQPALAYIG